MRRFVYQLLLLILFFGIFTVSAQQNANTLLWRIHKNGIEKPSFLFGTMHVSDKKAFNFQDSLYFYVQQADAFASEFNPDSANDVMAAYLKGELSYEKDDWSEKVAARDMEKMKKIAARDVRAGSVPENNRGVIGYFVNRLVSNEKKQTESMNTFMDAFLYEMAWQHGKQIFGLEELDGKGEVLNALSKGLKVKKINNLLDRWDPSADDSPLSRLYFKEDIDSIHRFYDDFFTTKALNTFLYDRNEVMANRMDSLMQGRSLFAAVGAGHLSGEKGMIALLRQKGWIVEPVLSQQRIAADEYQFKNPKRHWQLIKNEEYGFRYQLPGVSKTQEGAAGRKIVYHYDIGGGAVFMTIFGKVPLADRKKNVNEIITGHLDEMMRIAGGKILSRKSISYDTLKGAEALCLYEDDAYYRYREVVRGNLFYILSVGSEKKDNLYSEKAEQYFSSFKPEPIPTTNWSLFPAPADGFSVLFPGRPKIEAAGLDKETAATISMNYYTWFDANSGINYSVTTGKALAGNEYSDGDSFFQNYVDHINSLSRETPVISDTIISGYNGKFFRTSSPGNVVKGVVIKRANNSYYVTTEYEPGDQTEAEADKFLRSFNIIAFKEPVWKLQEAPDKSFTAWLPGEIIMKKQDSTAYTFKTGEVQYFGHDPFASISYNVEIYPISKYYWAQSIDSVYSYWKNKVMSSWNDSLLSYSVTKNGSLAGRDLSFVEKASKTQKMIRLLLNDTIMYVLVTSRPHTFADENNMTRFFEDFRITREETETPILKNTSEKLFRDLRSEDSLTFQQAYDAIAGVQFMEMDIVLLMEKAMQQYPRYENNYQSVNDRLLYQVSALLTKNPSTDYQNNISDFIRQHYNKADKVIDSIRFYLLGMIAADKTSTSYELLNELLSTKQPVADNSYRFFTKLYDSLQLTRVMYPGLLNYISDSTVGLSVVSLTKTMIDSNHLKMDILLPVKQELIKLAKRQVKESKKEDYEFLYQLPPLIELLGYFKEKEMDDVVTVFLKSKETFIKKCAALTLIKNKRPVAASVLSAVANDLEYRTSLYDDLKKLDKEELFPRDLHSQNDLAEGYIVNSVYDEEEDGSVPEMIFIKKIEYTYKDEKRVFYIFRANYVYETAESEGDVGGESPLETTESYLCVAGPFDTDPGKVSIDEKENISGMWYEDKFDGMKADYFFRKYIEQQLKWQEEQKQ
jgi:uncharacterized protein YbaP (TraB family)